MKQLFILLFILPFMGFSQNVGINEAYPEETLHLGSTTGTVRVDKLNETNSIYNGGGTDTYRTYVDNNGEFTLKLIPTVNSGSSDALIHTDLPDTNITLLETDADGMETQKIVDYTLTVTRQTYLEVKYTISFEVYLSPAYDIIWDNYARRVSTYFTVDGVMPVRRYGSASKCYTSGGVSSSPGEVYNTSTAYIDLPAAGTYTVSLYGEISSNTKSGGPGSTSNAMHVEFARGNDAMFMVVH